MTAKDILFKDYLCSLKKDDLDKIVDIYNKLATRHGLSKLSSQNMKKDARIEQLLQIKNNYVKYIILDLEYQDYDELKNNALSNDLANYLKSVYLMTNSGEIPKDISITINKLLKEKEVVNNYKKWRSVKIIIDGIIVAYGLVDLDYFKNIIDGIKEVDYDEVFERINNYYKKEYRIDKNKIYSTKLTNKKRIDSYYKNKDYKNYKINNYVLLGNKKYHYGLKPYKKLIRLLKNYYVFKRKDIIFIDEKIIIPYLYNSLNEEENANKNLNSTIEELFEFKKDKLKDQLINNIMEIRNYFPLWEYRGYSKMEVCKK